MVVIDSNVFAKLFAEEHDSTEARAFFKYCVTNNIPLLAPTLFSYEVLQIAIYYDYPLHNALEVLESSEAFNLNLKTLSKEDWLNAEEMVQSGHEKSGFPSLYDCSYHVLALSQGCVFLTADKRHAIKTKQFGAIKLLQDWQEIFAVNP